MKKFEIFLRDRHKRIYDLENEEHFENWLHEMDVEDWLAYGELHAEMEAVKVIRGEK